MSPVISPRRADTGSPGAPRGGSFAGHPDDDPCGRSDTGAAPRSAPMSGVRSLPVHRHRHHGPQGFLAADPLRRFVPVSRLIQRQCCRESCNPDIAAPVDHDLPDQRPALLAAPLRQQGIGDPRPADPGGVPPSPAPGSFPRRAAARAGPRAWPGRAGRRARRRSEPIRGRIPETVDYRGAPAYQSVWKLPARHSPADAKGAPR